MSRIAAIQTHSIAVPLKRKHRTAHEPRDDVTLLLVEVRSDDGVTGYGQVTSTPMKDIAQWVERLAATAVGMDARAPAAVWEALFALTSPRVGAGGLPRGADYRLIQLAILALATYPMAFGQIARLVTGRATTGARFRRDWYAFLRWIGRRLFSPPGKPGTATRKSAPRKAPRRA